MIDLVIIIMLNHDFLIFQLGSGQTHKIILEFLPQQFPGIVDILVFINDKEGKNEETFCLKANYK